MGMTTLSVKDGTAERFHDLKADLDDVQDAPDHTVNSFMQALLDTWDAADDGYYDEPETAEIDPNELAREVSKQFDYAMLADQVAEEIEGRLR